MGNLKRSIARKSTQNKNMQADSDYALDKSKVDRSQFRVMKKKTKKTVDNAKKNSRMRNMQSMVLEI